MSQPTALLSVSDKTGIVDFARALHRAGRAAAVHRRHRAAAGRRRPAVTEVAEVTGFARDARRPRQDAAPAHPRRPAGAARPARAHGGAGRARHRHHRPAGRQPLPVCAGHGAAPTARWKTRSRTSTSAARPCCARRPRTGPTWRWSSTPPTTRACSQSCAPAACSATTRFMLARKVFAHTAAYDGMISNYLSALQRRRRGPLAGVPRARAYPAVLTLQLTKTQDLRYGENPHQSAAFYRDAAPAPGLLAGWTQLQGKELSLQQHRRCRRGVGVREDLRRRAGLRDRQARQPLRRGRWAPAWPRPTPRRCKTDPTSAFGGIIAFNRPLDGAAARARRQAVRRGGDRAGHHAPRRAPSSPPSRTCACWRCRWRAGAPMPWTSSASAAACCCRAADTRNVGARRAARGHQGCRPPRRSWTTCCSPGRWPSS